jgi:exopolyphosphatase/guanosine-5'-triphosphate,3'-diphosphate pyrophosphatase
MTRVAAIDCGTNSVRLLIADVDGGVLTDVHREVRLVRLGQGVDATGLLAPEAIERTRVALHGYAAAISRLGAGPVRMVATSATRDARNRDDFAAVVRAELGIAHEVITGVEEARLALAGARSALGDGDRGSGDVLVLDLGGGSTELIRGGDDGRTQAYSMDVGSVRLTERHLRADPPTRAEIDALERDVRAALVQARAEVDVDAGVPVIGVAATVLTVAALALDLPAYEPGSVHGRRIPTTALTQVADRLLTMTHDQRSAEPVIAPGRADVIAAGAAVLRVVLTDLGIAELTASEHDILDGIALALG